MPFLTDLTRRSPKATDFILIETAEEETAKTELTAENLGFATAQKVTELDGKISQLETKLEGEITAAIAGAFVAKGSVNYADLPEPTEANVGDTYNIKDQFVADEKIVPSESGHTFPAGTNVVCVEKEGQKAFDPMTGFIDTSKLATVESLNALQQTVTSNGETLTTLQSTVNDPSNGLSKVKEDLDALSSAVNNEESGLAATKAIADAAKSTANAVKTAVEDETTGLAATKKIADDAKTTADAAKKSAADLKTDVETNYLKIKKATPAA